MEFGDIIVYFNILDAMKHPSEDHFPLPFIDQMLERLAGKSHYYFLDGFFWLFTNSYCSQGSRKDHIHLSLWHFCLEEDALWPMQHPRYLPTVYT